MNLQVGKLKMPEKDITLNLSKTKTKLICKTLTADSTSIYTAISNHLKHHSPTYLRLTNKMFLKVHKQKPFFLFFLKKKDCCIYIYKETQPFGCKFFLQS